MSALGLSDVMRSVGVVGAAPSRAKRGRVVLKLSGTLEERQYWDAENAFPAKKRPRRGHGLGYKCAVDRDGNVREPLWLQRSILKALAESEGSLTMLSDACKCNSASMYTTMKTLIKRGLAKIGDVDRKKHPQLDWRAKKHYYITQLGRDALEVDKA